jgi:hypothetical protein
MPPPLSVPLGAGWPEFHHQDRDERIAWAAYLHERVAWHAAGSIDRVDSLSHRIGAISVGADRDLETALGLDADEAFAVLGGPVRNDLLTSTRTLSGHSNLTIPRGLSGQSRVVSRPAPWLARALLRAKPDHPERRYLASLTVCRPLADRLLGQCQDMEQRCRDRLLPQLPDNLHDQWVSSRYAKYKARQSAEYIYAPGELLDLQSEWEFADFESIIKASNLNKREGDIMHELRILRNILAHGQAIGWKATTTIERLEYALFRHK